MSTALLDDLLAGYTTPVRIVFAEPSPAKTANFAQSEHPCASAADSGAANGLRIPANPEQTTTNKTADSQEFAGVRSRPTVPRREYLCGSSQDSQDSQGYHLRGTAPHAFDLAAVAWTAEDIAAYFDRRARLLRWGWSEADAEGLAERLVKADRDHDERVSCTDCRHYRPGRCGNHGRAGLATVDVGRDMVTLLQRCPGYAAHQTTVVVAGDHQTP